MAARAAGESSTATSAAGPPDVRLVIFGDSWARDDDMMTWPELFGSFLGWPSLNVALPGSHSGMLQLQVDLLNRVLAQQQRQLHPDAWAMVHAGGNDLLHSSPSELLSLVGQVLCCCCCLSCGSIPLIDRPIANVRALALRLREQQGVRNLVLCGLPLTVHMPVIEKYLELLMGVGTVIKFLGRVAVGRLNALYMRRLAAMSDEVGVRVVLLDEATEIESIVASVSSGSDPVRGIGGRGRDVGGRGGGGRGGGGRGGGGRGGAPGDDELSGAGSESDAEGVGAPMAVDGGQRLLHPPPAVSPDELWCDMLHPSQRLHTALSVRMLERFRTPLLADKRLAAAAGLSDEELAYGTRELLELGSLREWT